MINLIFGILGITGGLLCAVGDILFDLKGQIYGQHKRNR